MFWTVIQAANFLNKPRDHVNYLIDTGKLEAIKIGKVFRIVPEDVKKYKNDFPPSTDCIERIFEKLPAILSARDIAVYFNYKRKAVYNLILTGRIPAWKDPEGAYCISKSEFMEYCFNR